MQKFSISLCIAILFLISGCKKQVIPDNTLVAYPTSGKKYIAYQNSTVEQFCLKCSQGSYIGVEFYRRNKVFLSRRCKIKEL